MFIYLSKLDVGRFDCFRFSIFSPRFDLFTILYSNMPLIVHTFQNKKTNLKKLKAATLFLINACKIIVNEFMIKTND